MRPHLVVLPLLFAAVPAGATRGFDCWTANRDVVLTGSFGSAIGMPMDAAFLQVGGRTLTTHGAGAEISIARNWLDEEGEIRLDLASRHERRFVARLRARVHRDGTGSGTLVLDGVAHRVRCAYERMDM